MRPEPSASVHIFLKHRMTLPNVLRTSVARRMSCRPDLAAGAALAAKRGERSKASLKGASREMVETMSEQQLREFASTKRRGLPRKRSA